jgi:SAM-dependent methyltransferase
MRREALDLLCCPACGGRLAVRAADSNDREIVAGSLVCEACGRQYPVERRMPYLYVDDERWSPKAREAEGWVSLHKKRGIYDQTGVDIDFRVPCFEHEPWITVARHFRIGLELASLTGGETVLDLGAGRGWAAKQFALKGCRVAAIDVMPDEQVGLGRAWAIMEQAGVWFDPVIGDNENLPFQPSTFDLVFCVGVLHHTSDLRRLLASVYKVLKPGGRLIAINEPCIRPHDNTEKVLQQYAAEELSLGINETRPSFLDYLDALQAAGFARIEIFPADTYGQSHPAVEAWARQLDVVAPPVRAWSLRGLPHILGGYVQRRLNMWSFHGRLPRPRSKREALIQAIMVHKMTDVIIFAERSR